MRKSFLVIALMLIASITMTTNSAQACPNGYDLHTATIMINGCLYEVDMCYKCPYGPVPGFAQIQEIRKLDTACVQTLTLQRILDAAEAQLCNFDYINNTLCMMWTVPPCPAQSQTLTIHHWICWQTKFINYLGTPVIVYSPCDYNAECVEEYTACYDPVTRVYTRTPVVAPHLEGGTPTCTLEAWDVIEPTTIGGTTPCYIIHNICIP